MPDFAATPELAHALRDRYAITRELGRGGMATVYLAHDVHHDRAVALKVLRPELAAMLGSERFLRAIRTTARLQHPHILPVHDSGAAAGMLWYTMPYVEGESLRDRLRRETQLPLDDALGITREVGLALRSNTNGLQRGSQMARSVLHGTVQMACLVVLALACRPKATPPPPEPEVKEIERQQAHPDRDQMGPLGVPEADLPPLGECRVWLPGQPAAQQAPPQPCGEAEGSAPPGAWVLYRPKDDERVVHIRVTDPVKRGTIIRIDIYDAEKGTYLGTKDVEPAAR